jgi:hypothetical protein
VSQSPFFWSGCKLDFASDFERLERVDRAVEVPPQTEYPIPPASSAPLPVANFYRRAVALALGDGTAMEFFVYVEAGYEITDGFIVVTLINRGLEP